MLMDSKIFTDWPYSPDARNIVNLDSHIFSQSMAKTLAELAVSKDQIRPTHRVHVGGLHKGFVVMGSLVAKKNNCRIPQAEYPNESFIVSKRLD